MIRHQLKVCGIKGKVLVCLALLSFLGGLAAAPALAQTPAGPQALPENPAAGAPPEEKKEDSSLHRRPHDH